MNNNALKTIILIATMCIVTSCSLCQGQDAVAIYTMDSDGLNSQFFTVNEKRQWNGSASWSHDGTRIVFDASSHKYGNGENHVFMRAVQGVHYLDFGSAPVWSPDDSQIAFVVQKSEGDDVQHGIWVVDAEGPNRQFVCPGYRPCWSPDGKSIAYSDPQSGRNQLFIRDLKTGKEQTIRWSGRIGWHPKWSPNGKRILFFQVDDSRAFRIVTVSPMGADKPVVLKDQSDYFYNADASWSPDGSRIVFSSDRFSVVDELHGLIGLKAGLKGSK